MSRRAFALAAAIIAAAGGMGIPLIAGPDAGADTMPSPVFPRPGGGPQAIHSFKDLTGTQAWLLNTDSGEYQQMPFEQVQLAPDGRTVMVESIDGRVGLANRRALLRAGESAVRWTRLPAGTLTWSPDGRALLSVTPDKTTQTVVAHRLDLATGRIRSITLPVTTRGAAGWAADSRRYVAQLGSTDPDVADGQMVYINPDGTTGPLVGTTGHIWGADAYSPDRMYAIVEPSRGGVDNSGEDWGNPRILDLRSRRVVSVIRTDWPVLGWYDDRHVVRIAVVSAGHPTTLEVVDIRTGVVAKRVPAPGLTPAAVYQVGPSERLRGDAANLGF